MMRNVLLLGLAGCSLAAGETMRASDEAPVVLELFTSQGCSSCPPADALLAKLGQAGQAEGRPVVALSFHVDYWNDIGWADPFSTHAWTERQQQYSRALGDDRVDTPELVVGGGAGMVGSQGAKVAQAIKAAPRQQLIEAKASWSAGSVEIRATAPDGADVWVAIWEDAAKTKVTSGENSGEMLLGYRVVRKLERVATAGKPGTLSVALPTTWKAGGAVAFAQRPDRRIVGSRVLMR
ncbi:thioredoxin family protein [soil metagenome]